MTKIQKRYSGNFTILENTVLEDVGLSLQAKGLFALLWHLPDDWKFREREIERHSLNGKDSTVKARKELEAKGYLIRTRKRIHGKFNDIIWTLVEKPPRAGNPPSVYPPSENPQLQSTNKQITNKPNTNIGNLSLTPSLPELSTGSKPTNQAKQKKREIKNKPLTDQQTETVKMVRNLFGQWGITLSEYEKGMLCYWAQHYQGRTIYQNAQSALGRADDSPFWYLATLMKQEKKDT
jgi:hypothetical protein